MAAEVGFDGKKGGRLALCMEILDQTREWKVRHAIAVVRQKDFIASEVLLNAPETLTDIRVCPGIHKGDSPVLNIPLYQLDLLAPIGQNKIIRCAFVVIQKVVFDDAALIAEA